jgi:hypothetical protein
LDSSEPPLRSDAKAVANDEHPNHQLRIDQRSACMAVEGSKVAMQIAKIEESIDVT